MKRLLLPLFLLILVSCQKDRRIEYRVFMDHRDSCTAEWSDGYGNHSQRQIFNGFHASYYEAQKSKMKFTLWIHKKENNPDNPKPVIFEARIDGDLVDAFRHEANDSIPFVYTYRSEVPKK